MMLAIGIWLTVICAMLEGWALSVLWGWFVVPVFGLPHLRIPVAIGIALLVGMVTHRVRKEEHQPDTVTVLAHGLVMPFIYVGIAWIVKLFI